MVIDSTLRLGDIANMLDKNNKVKKVMVVYGTRPEAIKVAPVIQKLESDARFETVTVVTGQHRSMLDQVNEVFGIIPDIDLELFTAGQSLNSLASGIFSGLDDVLEEHNPDAVVVQGDTTTVMASAVAAFYRGIPVVHLEAGLRSHDIKSPFPEEANRKIVSQIADLHLAPTQTSKRNLLVENTPGEKIVVTGNTVVDALFYAVESDDISFPSELETKLDQYDRVLLVTSHRRENWGDAMKGVGAALRDLAEKYEDLLIVLPAHKNPVVREAILPSIHGLPNVHTCEPLPYLQFSHLLRKADIVLTDSGGIQEEAPSLGKPVLVMRSNTERPEAVEAGTVRLIGTVRDRILFEVSRLLDDQDAYGEMARAVNPYGDGKAAGRSVEAIAELLAVGTRVADFDPS